MNRSDDQKLDDDEPTIRAADAFFPFTEIELEELKMFAQHLADIDDLDLANRKTMTMNLGPSGPAMEDVDKEQISALMSAYRKIALLNDEPGTFNKVRNLLARHVRGVDTDEARSMGVWLKTIKRMRKDLQGESRVMGYVLEHPDGTTEKLAPRTIIGWLVNGVISHSDPEDRKRWDQLGGWNSGGILMNVLITVSDDLQIFRGVNLVVGEILENPDLHDVVDTE